MRRQPALPRLAREGFVSAGPEKRITKRHMLIPKSGDPTEHIPRLFDFSEVICPVERRALREIVETAEVVRENGHAILVARVSAATLDSLATFETSREDLEDSADHEPSIGSGNGYLHNDVELDTADDEPEEREAEHDGREPDHDDEYDYRNQPPI